MNDVGSMTPGWAGFLQGVALQTGALCVAALLVGVPAGFFEDEVIQAVGPVWREVLSHVLNGAATFLVCGLFAFWRPQGFLLAVALSFIATELIIGRLSWLIGGIERPLFLLALEVTLAMGSSLCGALVGRMLRARRCGIRAAAYRAVDDGQGAGGAGRKNGDGQERI
ncbi:hypothetical protein KQ945_15650 [Bacillus subtilis subsp. subtilis]|nr:hypothetical protein [Bacillus subtilis subsp. subtilis]